MNSVPGYYYPTPNYPYPDYNSMCPPQQRQQPTASAVTINVIEPKAYAGGDPAAQSPYSYPQTSLYNQPGVMYPNQYYQPQVPQYYPPQMPQYYPQQPMMPQGPQYTGQPMMPQGPQYTQQYPDPYQQMPQQYPPQYPQPPYQDPNQQLPPQYPPPYPDPNQQIPQPPVAPDPNAQQPQDPNSPQQLSANDIPAVNAALLQPDDNVKAAALEAIAKIGQGDADTYKNLINIVTTDTNKLNGDAKVAADTNKKHAMWTLAVLNKNQNPDVPLSEIPGGAEIAKSINAETNPEMRKAAIAALDFMAKPSDAPILSKIYQIIAKRDKNPEVKALAQQALNNLNQQAAAPAQQAQA